jgi:hypothetical protein
LEQRLLPIFAVDIPSGRGINIRYASLPAIIALLTCFSRCAAPPLAAAGFWISHHRLCMPTDSGLLPLFDLLHPI